MAITKVIELVGTSPEGWEEAARSALAGAARSLHGIVQIQVMDWTALVTDGEIIEYQAVVKVSFLVD